MIKRPTLSMLLCLSILWIGSLWHEVFPTQVLPALAATADRLISVATGHHCRSALALVSSGQVVSLDDDASGLGGNSHPSPEHVHTPWSLWRVDSPTAHCCTAFAFAAPELEATASRSPLTAARPFNCVPQRLPVADLYLVHRVLLI